MTQRSPKHWNALWRMETYAELGRFVGICVQEWLRRTFSVRQESGVSKMTGELRKQIGLIASEVTASAFVGVHVHLAMPEDYSFYLSLSGVDKWKNTMQDDLYLLKEGLE